MDASARTQTNPNSLANLALGTRGNADQAAQQRANFLRVLPDYWPNIAEACRAVGWTRSSAYLAKSTDSAFRQAWDDIIEARIDRLEHRVIDVGATTPQMVGLLMPVLKAYRRHIYGDRLEHTGTVATVHVQTTLLAKPKPAIAKPSPVRAQVEDHPID